MCEKYVFNVNNKKYSNVWDLERYLSYFFATNSVKIYYFNSFIFNFNYFSGKTLNYFQNVLGDVNSYNEKFEDKIDKHNEILKRWNLDIVPEKSI
jgi:hypothetical protein